ncbi:probable cytochrome P450 28a5 [Culicoides brevitarsis]|uniref:probable cytochrome P450 28a5 n=1 Tax=Culicoides brevitarsis TaxID=469753 RepID=UPI00307B8379
MFTTLLIFVSIVVLFYKYVTYRQSYWKRKGIKGPKPTFLAGNLFNSFLQKEAFADDVDRIYKQYKDRQGVIGIYQLLKPTLMVTDSQIVKHVLVENFKNFHMNGFEKLLNEKSDPLLAYNPFFRSGDAWKDKRSEVTPAFSPARIKAMYPLIESVCEKMKEYIEKAANSGQALEGKDLSSRYTCDVVTKCIFSADAMSFENENNEIRKQAANIFGSSFFSIIFFTMMEICPALFKTLRIGFVPKATEAFFRDLMRQAIDHRQKSNVNSQDYLDFLLQMQKKKGLSDLEVAASGITFFLDGLETSAVGISYILYELASNKEVQDKLREELKSAENLDYDTLVNLPYLDQVFHESLRMHPPAGFLNRVCTEPIELDIGKEKKFFVEKGTTLLLPIHSIHYDDANYDEPEKFKPDRFNDGAIKDYRDNGKWLTFGDGPRTCLGQRFAKAQSKACIATILLNFEISVNEKTMTPLRLDPKDFLGSALGGIWLNFKKINN